MTTANSSTTVEAMTKHEFTLVLTGADVLDDPVLNALYEAGCDDATFGERGSVQYAAFHRRAPTFAAAVTGAIRVIEETASGTHVIRVEPEDFVSLSAIARRCGRSRESIRLLAEGARGPGGFPDPVRWVDARTTLWRWSEVAEWFERAVGEEVSPPESARFVAALNGFLETRHQASFMEPSREWNEIVSFARRDQKLKELLRR